jgi:hypothetical protein
VKSRVTSATHDKGVVLAKKGGDKPGTNSKGKANSKAAAVPDKKKKKGKTVVRSMQVQQDGPQPYPASHTHARGWPVLMNGTLQSAAAGVADISASQERVNTPVVFSCCVQVMPASGAFEGSVSPRSRSRRVLKMGAQRRASVHTVNPEDLF